MANVASSLSGTVRQTDGTAVGGVSVAIVGRGYTRTTVAEPDGRYAFFDLVPQSYRIALGREARKTWRARSVKATLAASSEDVAGLDLIVTPH
ncbi:MAG TPA: carboxypeptidase-like regulatory domain-containing protein [Candidatus Dormibacteraeota bacterium]|nr:carboxypeptidase-like regulatory domain-containing protein [Candidatus Dormibacteraeota bacterium]